MAYGPKMQVLFMLLSINGFHLITDLWYLNPLILRPFEHFEDRCHLTENSFAPLEVQMGKMTAF